MYSQNKRELLEMLLWNESGVQSQQSLHTTFSQQSPILLAPYLLQRAVPSLRCYRRMADSPK